MGLLPLPKKANPISTFTTCVRPLSDTDPTTRTLSMDISQTPFLAAGAALLTSTRSPVRAVCYAAAVVRSIRPSGIEVG